ncbi:hypothetical protein D770_22525 [Flammeovirgaceae bacterium 311]|nr:hypothetical protein D770_22525 [Flammeovirgaceae bacterium 311]
MDKLLLKNMPLYRAFRYALELLTCIYDVQASTPGVLFDAHDLLKNPDSATAAQEDLTAGKSVMPLKI